jgi:hypothetical protein
MKEISSCIKVVPMAKTKVTAGMWRIDPQKRSRVIDRYGQPVASAEGEAEGHKNASLMAAAPDMFELLELLETNPALSEDVVEEIQLVLRRARGDFGLAVFSRGLKHLRSRSEEWMKFIDRLWHGDIGE